MESERKKGYAWAILAGLNAAFSAVSAKYFSSLLKYALVVIFNVIMWGCYVNSMKSLSSLQATVTNFATNFLASGSSGFFLFGEALPFKEIGFDNHLSGTVMIFSRLSSDPPPSPQITRCPLEPILHHLMTASI
ncbi:hypothetical protein ACS0TY_015166 [Phlomoides rotata]